MKYKGIVEVTLRPELPDVNSVGIMKALKAANFEGIESVRQGKVIEVEFESDALDPANTLERMCQELLAHPFSETYGYRLSWVGQEGYGETTMRYRVGHHDVQQADITGKFPSINDYELVNAEWWAKDHKLALIRYLYKGQPSKLGIRMDLTTRQFIDSLDDPDADVILKGMATAIWDEIVLGMKAAP